MKQPSNAAHDACEALRTVNCPVGCTECPYDNDRFSARFSKTRLQERHWLPGAAHRSHRILFLLSGHIHVCMDSRDNHYLSGGRKKQDCDGNGTNRERGHRPRLQ